MRNKLRTEELLSMYSLGVLKWDEVCELLELIESGSDEELVEILKKNRDIESLLPYSVNTVNPPKTIEEKLFARISQAKKSMDNDSD